MVDEKIVDRIRKVLALADRAGTEGEALAAQARADAMMKEYGIEMATIEMTGGKGEGRAQDGAEVVGLGREDWSRDLMDAIAEANFCSAFAKSEGDRKLKLTGFTIFGRKSAVITTQLMFHYLYRTVIRLSRAEKGSQRFFRFGCAERITQRIRDRHVAALEEQRKAVQDAARAPSGASSTGNALVVVLEDYERSERDANNDFRRGLPDGTTARERTEREARYLAKRTRRDELMAQGISEDLTFWMVEWDMTLEEATAKEAQWKEDRKKDRPYRPRVDHAERRRQSESYAAGSRAGEKVGLDAQVTQHTRPGSPLLKG